MQNRDLYETSQEFHGVGKSPSNSMKNLCGIRKIATFTRFLGITVLYRN